MRVHLHLLPNGEFIDYGTRRIWREGAESDKFAGSSARDESGTLSPFRVGFHTQKR